MPIADETQLRVDAVLPLTASDLPRAELLFKSLERFFEGLSTCWVVVPDRDVAEVRAKMSAPGLSFITDSELLTELMTWRLFRTICGAVGLPCVPGWYVQQLVKLAIVKHIRSEFYLTLDADVICVRPTHAAELVSGGRAIAATCPWEREAGWPDAVASTMGVEPEWYDAAATMLGASPPSFIHGVTPAVLSRRAVLGLQEHLEAKAKRGKFGIWTKQTWVAHLTKNRPWRTCPWTEYSLYATFLESSGSFETYHHRAGADALYGNCVWWPGDWPEWSAARSFASPRRFPFSVIQSRAEIPLREIQARLEGYLEPSSPVGTTRATHC